MLIFLFFCCFGFCFVGVGEGVIFGVCFGGWGWGGGCLGFVLGVGGGEDVVWGLFWGGGGCFGFVVGGGVLGEGLQGMIMKAEHQ